ncbi:hypothetical protein MOX02_56980 [Methylobacterium oxalidis]|uniref:Uncharacterized protein n=1 Tax=Methylobacterium oxalidis TaxID=944322 RepID=A0A512JCG3_9HYPH|nr:hypothetical protein MOX02_56980 [Methylobacterium oxalidis]GLS66135.1 hypothetical protein GCM10007888_45170 [Methylobacterium oxalidis]
MSAMSAQAILEPQMVLVWAGVLLFISSILLTAFTALWGGRFRARNRTDSAAGFKPRANWPGLVMLAVGVLMLPGRGCVPTPVFYLARGAVAH